MGQLLHKSSIFYMLEDKQLQDMAGVKPEQLCDDHFAS